MSEPDDEEYWTIRIPRGYTKTRSVRALFEHLDTEFARRSAEPLPDEVEQVEEDISIRPDASLEPSDDDGPIDSEPESGTSDRGESDPRIELEGDTVDEGPTGTETETPLPPVRDIEQPPTDERIQKKSSKGSGEYGDFEFHFAPGQFR